MGLRDKIFLIGMPGSGKSTMGCELAQKLHFSFIDLDNEVERKAGLSIKEIFSKHGEAHFRELERNALIEVLEVPGRFVVATGGGTPCFFDNMDVIRKGGTSVFIDVSLEELTSRLSDTEKEKRPKFSGAETLSDMLGKLLHDRRPFYQRADFHLENSESLEPLITYLEEKTDLSDDADSADR